ncbi:hypothetical protein ASU33_19185 [Solirubrum puertoriconensis]|uniref:Uncharacterized protein n=1 Tax=Solirubrum puertoriconensis TaxID=1751427 RepID=A0A9X0HPL5_SOLP1|nr:hypothetical protein ASU33_19185 [Solirubrum puertoriconensis]
MQSTAFPAIASAFATNQLGLVIANNVADLIAKIARCQFLRLYRIAQTLAVPSGYAQQPTKWAMHFSNLH